MPTATKYGALPTWELSNVRTLGGAGAGAGVGAGAGAGAGAGGGGVGAGAGLAQPLRIKPLTTTIAIATKNAFFILPSFLEQS